MPSEPRFNTDRGRPKALPRKRVLFCVCLCASVACVAVARVSVAGAEIIDRVLAVVNGSLITLSDAHGALRFGLVARHASVDPLQDAVDQLIERRLVLSEVERYGPAEPSADAIDAALAATRSRFASGAAFEAALRETGITGEELRRQHRDELRAEGYVQQRFAQVVQPTEDEVLAYYRSHEAEFTRDGALRPDQDVRGDARAALAAARRVEVIREWIGGLRRRADVTILPLR